MRRGSIASLVGIGIIAGGIATAVALALAVAAQARLEGGRSDRSAVLVRDRDLHRRLRRRRRGDDSTRSCISGPRRTTISDGPPIHGHTDLEIIWTLIPTVLVTAIGIVSAVVLARNDAAGANFLRVNVTAQQFAWSFSYPDAKGLTSGVLRLPKDRSVRPHPAVEGRDPFILGPGVLAEARHRAGHHDHASHHAEPARHVSRDLHRALRPRPRGDAYDG